MTLPERLSHYARLMRLDKPIGILLLLWPTLWAQWLASAGRLGVLHEAGERFARVARPLPGTNGGLQFEHPRLDLIGAVVLDVARKDGMSNIRLFRPKVSGQPASQHVDVPERRTIEAWDFLLARLTGYLLRGIYPRRGFHLRGRMRARDLFRRHWWRQ